MEELIVRVLSGEATELEVRRLEVWRAESPEHERTYTQMQRVWQVTGAPPAERAQRPRRWQLIAVAAAAVVLLILGLPRMQRQPTASFATGAGEHRTVTLADGSIVRLGPESVLDVRGTSPRSTRHRLDQRASRAGRSSPSRPIRRVRSPLRRPLAKLRCWERGSRSRPTPTRSAWWSSMVA